MPAPVFNDMGALLNEIKIAQRFFAVKIRKRIEKFIEENV